MSSLSPHEEALLNRVKNNQDSAAVLELINLHTGIYFSIASKYSRAYPDVIKLNDLNDDRMTNIYKWVIEYKTDKDMKLGTYIGERTDFLCRTMLKKERHNPLGAGVIGIPSGEAGTTSTTMGSDTEDSNTQTFNTTLGDRVYIVDQTASARPAEVANQTVGLDDIMKSLDDPILGIDPRFKPILNFRHFTKPPLTWRAIGKELHLSHEMARKIYFKGMDIVQTKMGGHVS